MRRVIAIVACGFSLTACTSSWMPSFDMPSFGGSSSSVVAVAVESDPPGAEARVAGGGQGCRTPCTLSVTPTGPFAISVALNGYVAQSVPVRLVQPEEPRLGSDETGAGALRVDPNPVYVELERAPTPVPPAVKKKQPPKRTPTAFAPAAVRAPTTAAGPNAAPAPQAQQAPQPAANAPAPWPMPR